MYLLNNQYVKTIVVYMAAGTGEYGVICSTARNDFPEFNACAITVTGDVGTQVSIENRDGTTNENIPSSGRCLFEVIQYT